MKSECFIASLWPFAASTPPMHCDSVTLSGNNCGNDEGAKCRWTMLNHVEPFHFGTQLLTAWKAWVMSKMPWGKVQTWVPQGWYTKGQEKRCGSREGIESHETLAMRREMRRVTWRKVAKWSEQGRVRVTSWEGVGWFTGRNVAISKCSWQIAGLATWSAPHPLRKQGKMMQKIKIAITSFRDEAFRSKPLPQPRLAQNGHCNEHRQKAKSCVLNYEILMFHCFTVTHLPHATPPVRLCFSDTQWQQLRQWWGSKMSLNHVEPCWTLPLRNTTFDWLDRPCPSAAPASAITSESGNTCFWSQASQRFQGIAPADIQCFNDFRHVTMYVSRLHQMSR